MTTPHIVAIHAFTDNYIWVIRDHYHAAVVDPGDASPVLDYLKQEKLKLIAILNTHHHNDHVGGNAALLREFTVPVFGPANESIPTVTHPLKECNGKESEEGIAYIPEFSLSLRVLDIPGHTAGHIAYYGANLLFCGDTLFACGCGRLFEGTAPQMVNSLQKLADLPKETGVYCGHEYTLNNIRFARTVEPGNQALIERETVVEALRKQNIPTLPSSIAIERAINPFLRCNQPEIIRNASVYAGKPLSDPVSVFAALRDWKNHF
ncbi:hydroxyacylglutathione hydrolase [Nitrosospira sp. Nsp13]|uniref:hydroxyacylglutathione hydrolase n=1 Tax=Nitrosospira sp. Nsp13 TaxID=1855332 RepID=UPI00088CAA9D|nr:hydroxyacylglutathione hydrolase [Nitrosospira sp. Nsp13]SCX88566.1 hydroxyacylglutathione hydrolase [Nitrosospira sp. Nsp13]